MPKWFIAKKLDDELEARIRTMLPGLLVEQGATVLLENINVFVMGFVSTAALAGVGQVNTVNNTVMNLFQAFAIGGTVLTAQSMGGGNEKRARDIGGASIFLGLVASLALTALLYIFRESILTGLFGRAEADVLQSSRLYFAYTLFTPPFWFLYFQCCGIMRSCGNTVLPMVTSVILNVLSIMLNIVFVMLLDMKAAGAGLALMISIAAASVIALALVLRPSFAARPALPALQALGGGIRNILRIAVPAAVENLFFNGSRVVLQFFLAGMGTLMISANQVFNSASSIVLVPFMALYYLVIPIVARETGSGDRAAARDCLGRIYKKSLKWSLWTAVALVLAAYPLCILFTRDAGVLKTSVNLMVIYAAFMMLQPASYILPNGFKGAGDVMFAMSFSSITVWVIRVLGTWLLGVKLGIGAYAVVLTQCIDYLARGTAYYLRFKGDRWLSKVKSIPIGAKQ